MNKTIRVYTTQISQWRLVKKLGISFIDITVKTGCKAFAPRWEDLMQYKNGTMGREEYTDIYLQRMQKSLELFPHEWDKLKDHDSIALACYCGAGDFCHRHIFQLLVRDYLTKQGVNVIMKDEITKDYLVETPKQIGTDIILRMQDNHLIQHYLMASYCYYMLDESPMTDEAYDLVCKLLTERWDQIEHQHKKFISFADNKVASAFNEVSKYPTMVRVAAMGYTERITSGELFRGIEPHLIKHK